MRKLLMWIVVSVGIAALVRKLKRSKDDGASEVDSASADPVGDDPADELRRKLAGSRDDETPATGTAADPKTTVDELRSEVHEEGRAAIDEMQRSTED